MAVEKFSSRKVVFGANLYERNRDIIDQHLSAVNLNSSRLHYSDNATRDCINDICLAEGQANLRPQYEYLSHWIATAPPEWVELANAIKREISAQRKILETSEIENKRREVQRNIQKLNDKYSELLSKFNEVAFRKVSSIDDYGDENWEILEKEADILLAKIARKEGWADREINGWKKSIWGMPDEFSQIREMMISNFKAYYLSKKSESVSGDDFSNMSGIEFENHIANLLRENGFLDVVGTPKSGDQGADLICKKGKIKIVIQAKRYAGAVGNKAVQEVIGAIRFYDADVGWVIVSSTFTKSAKDLAFRNNVRLIDGYDLKQFRNIF